MSCSRTSSIAVLRSPPRSRPRPHLYTAHCTGPSQDTVILPPPNYRESRKDEVLRRSTPYQPPIHMFRPSTYFTSALMRSRLKQRCGPHRRYFHDYFVTHLPSSSLHPDSRTSAGPRHNLPRAESQAVSASSSQPGRSRSPASMVGLSREMTVVRIPLKSAKHHFGASTARGTRPYNEDTYQAGTIELPAFAKRAPLSLKGGGDGEGTAAGSASGDPQVFYFGVFDGHGGDVCSIWLREKLHSYVEKAATIFEIESTLHKDEGGTKKVQGGKGDQDSESGKMRGTVVANKNVEEEEDIEQDDLGSRANTTQESPEPQNEIDILQQKLVDSWGDTVGGYFRRFKPDYFSSNGGGQGEVLSASIIRHNQLEPPSPSTAAGEDHPPSSTNSLESMLSYSFLRADLDFVTGQDSLTTNNPSPPSDPNDDDESLGRHSHHSSQPFIGGSTCSIALISTPSSTPFWHPSTPFTITTAHLGDTRILLCTTATGAPIPLTATHHPSEPGEAARLRRYAASFTTDSFGEERLTGLANTRAFGDRRSKRVGVSAEPQLSLLHARPGEFSFMVLVSDGVTGVLGDREIVDVVKECRTPEEGARKIVGLATEVGAGEAGDADNATAVVVRMGGWERRDEGGGGSLGTREERERRRLEAGQRGGRR